MRTTLTLFLSALSGCLFYAQSRESGYDGSPVAFAVSAEPLAACAGTGAKLSIVTNAEVSADDLAVAFEREGVAHAATLVTGDEGTFVATAPVGLAAGTYALVVTKAGEQARVEGALTVTEGPVVQSVGGGAVCRRDGATPVVQVQGRALAGTSARLLGADGVGIDATITASSDGASAQVSVPAGVQEQMAYALVVTSPNGCAASVEKAVVVTRAPKAFAVSAAAPQLGDGNASLPVNTDVYFRLTAVSGSTGAELAALAAADVSLGGVTADSVSAGPLGALDVHFAANRLLPGAASTEVVVGGQTCAQRVALGHPLAATPATFALHAVNPTAVFAEDGAVFDVVGVLAQPSERASDAPAYLLEIDVNPDPLTDDFQPATLLYRMGPATGAADDTVRFVLHPTPSFDPGSIAQPFAANVRMTEQSSGLRLMAPRALWLLPQGAARAPRIVTHTPDALHFAARYQSGTGNAAITIYGCDLAGASFALLAQDGTTTYPLIAGSVALSPLAQSRYRCGASVLDVANEQLALSLDPLAMPPAGIYQLRAVAEPTAGEPQTLNRRAIASYPIVVYGDAPQLQTAAAVGALAQPRRFAKAAVASDVLGRKYVYVVGGDSVAAGPMTIAPQVVTPSVATTYELAPVLRNHSLGALAAADAGYPYPLATTGATLSRTYGMDLTADGSQLIFTGGTSAGTSATTSQAIYRAQVLDPTTQTTSFFGRLSPLAAQPQTLTIARFGHASILVPSASQRQLLTTGGNLGTELPVTITTAVDISTLGPSGLTASSGALSGGFALPNLRNQAFHTNVFIEGPSADSIASIGGIVSVQAATGATGPLSALNGLSLYPLPLAADLSAIPAPTFSSPLSTAPSGPLFGQAIFQAGPTLFFVGGARFEYDLANEAFLANLVDDATSAAVGATIGIPAAYASQQAPARMALAAQVDLPPMAYVFSGVRCDANRSSALRCIESFVQLNPTAYSFTITP